MSKQELQEELGQIGLNIQDGELRHVHFSELDYDAKWNVRKKSLYEDRVKRKLTELESDGMIRTPLVAVYLVGQQLDTKPIVSAGHLRIRAVELMSKTNKPLFEQGFKKIPVLILKNVTEDQRRRLVLDHGSEITLREDEVYLEFKKLTRCGYKHKPIANMLSKLFYQLARPKHQAEFNKRMEEFRKTGTFMIGKSEFRSAEDVAHQTWRGHCQYFQRILESPGDLVEKEWLAYMDGDANAIYPDRKFVELTHKCKTATEVKELIDKKRGTKEGKKTSNHKVWGPARLVQARSACQSHYYQVQLDAALGNEAATLQLPDLEDELVRIEQAASVDASRFWEVIDELAAQYKPEVNDIEEAIAIEQEKF